jgi:hypothetical protein
VIDACLLYFNSNRDIPRQHSREGLRLPDGDLASQAKRATTKSSVSRRFVALSTAKLKEWLAIDLSGLDLLVIQIDGLHVGDHVLVAAIGIDGAGDKHVLAVASSIRLNAQRDRRSAFWIAVQLGSSSSAPPRRRTRGRRIAAWPPCQPTSLLAMPHRWPCRSA